MIDSFIALHHFVALILDASENCHACLDINRISYIILSIDVFLLSSIRFVIMPRGFAFFH